MTPQVRNIAVLTTDAPVDEDEEQPGFTATIRNSTFAAGNAEVTVEITNNSGSARTYLVTGGSELALDQAYSVNIPAGGTQTVTVRGYYDANRVAPGTDGVSVTVEDINGADSQTLDITDGGDTSGAVDIEILKAGDEGATSNGVSAYQYLYAITIVNNNTCTHDVTVNVTGVPSGWSVAIMDEDGKTVAANGSTFQAYGLQTTVLYVKLMLLEPGQKSTAVPGVTASVQAGGVSEQLTLSAGDVEVTTDDMSVSGDNAFDERSGVPGGIWFLVAVILLMLVAIFWLASKRGVFSRR